MKKISLSLLILSAIVLTGCATKQYPQAAAVSPEERSMMTCKDAKLEIAKTIAIQREIEKTGDFDGKTVLGFLGDFGIGNGIAKSEAKQKVRDRLWNLEYIKESKCKKESKQTSIVYSSDDE